MSTPEKFSPSKTLQLSRVLDVTLAGNSHAATPLANRFLQENCQRYAMGRNVDTLAVHRHIGLSGVIDDYFAGSMWEGIPVFKTSQVPLDALVLNAVTSISPVAVNEHLHKSGFHFVVNLYELIQASEGKIEWPKFVLDQRREMADHLEEWQTLYEALEDEISRQTLLDTLRFRLTANPAYMQNYKVRIDEQYFEDFMQYSQEVFVDAGGFDGDTSEAFAKRYPDYKKIIIFEPSSKNIEAAKKRLLHTRDVEYRMTGLSDQSGTLSFNSEAGSASTVSEAGTDIITVETLDEAVTEQVSFIKMDLEGWEMKALHGASRHIEQNHPKLAIAVYHAAPDFRKVYGCINRINHNYRINVRHYTQGWSETVMFFK